MILGLCVKLDIRNLHEKGGWGFWGGLAVFFVAFFSFCWVRLKILCCGLRTHFFTYMAATITTTVEKYEELNLLVLHVVSHQAVLQQEDS